MDHVDEIEQRLRRLKEETSAAIQNDSSLTKKESSHLQKEIEFRLAKLTDRDPNYYSSSEPPVKIFSLKSNKTDAELADMLMEQVMKELSIDGEKNQHGQNVDLEIEKRLKQIRKANEEIIKVKVNSVRPIIIDDDIDDAIDQNEELNWCTTCNDDAVVRCLDCDNDAYCRECFK